MYQYAMQVLNFIQPDTTYRCKKAFGIRLDRAPLSEVIKCNILHLVKNCTDMGGNNIPRHFTTQDGRKVIIPLPHFFYQTALVYAIIIIRHVLIVYYAEARQVHYSLL